MEYALFCATKQLSSDYTVFFPFMGSGTNYDLIASRSNEVYKLAMNPKDNEWDYRMIFSKEKDAVIFVHRSMWKGKLEIRFEFPTNDVGEYYWWEDFLTLTEKPERRSMIGSTSIVMPTLIDKNDPIASPKFYANRPDMVRYGNATRSIISNPRPEVLSQSMGDTCTSNVGSVSFAATTLALSGDGVYSTSTTWPDAQTLQADLMNAPMTEIAAKYGVSDRTVSNWAKQYNLQVPPKGFWISKTKKTYLNNKGENNE